ncbi:MAG: hypothetical protein AVDCRST_MAG30-1676 [uncultured Solirubrobacteraceae bacterium]|uniref:Uncharacterized protein n=1 Tax=uncultured Solirubrobacteraceae bacterium TaxID=1162706 RepID=A0A6J4SDS4_9ACTN|nr:MAG: hypothetical protein AVDCRST_MAG30-1676 [uncultured Solirubrobacteraceae bacterium]
MRHPPEQSPDPDRRSPVNRYARLLLAAVLATVLLAACGGEQQVRTVTANPTPVQEEAAQTPEAETEAEAGGTPAPEGEPVAEGTGSANGQPFSVAILELKRSGPTVVLNGEVSVPADEADSDVSFQITDTFSDPAAPDQTSYDAFDGVALIDPQNRKKYLVARDADGECVCTRELSSAFARPDAPISVQATLTAPPPEVKTVDLYVPKVKTFTKVPVADE